jgi:hypothetical protein
MDIGKSGTFVGAHETPFGIISNPFHKQVGNPESVEQIASTLGFVTVIFAKIQKGKDVSMPRFQVASNAALALHK